MNKLTHEFEKEFRREEKDFKELKQDYNYILELNTQLANKYQEVLESFPTVDEINFLIENVEEIFYEVAETRKERLFKLNKFKSAIVALAAQDVNVLPPRYEEICS